MPRTATTFLKLTGLFVLVAAVATLTPQKSYGQKPGFHQSPMPVTVENTPLAVTGSLGVSGSIAATQSGVWNVGLTGTAAVTSGDQTAVLDSFAGEVPGGGAFFDEVFADVSAYKTVRVLTNCFLGADCGNITVRVYSIVAGRSYLVDQYAMPSFVAGGGVYSVMGTQVAVQLINSNATSSSNIGIALIGRAN